MALATLNCDEQDLNSLIDCLRCVSGDDLIAFQVRLLLQITGTEVSPENVQSALCVNCHSDEDLIRMQTALWAELAVAMGVRSDWNVQDLRDETRCFQCTNTHTLKSALTLLLCVYLKSRVAQ